MVSKRVAEHAGCMDDIRGFFARHGLLRAHGTGILGGVCSGIGRRFGLTPWITRLLFVVGLMVLPGSQVLIYPALWILMPSEDDVRYLASARASKADALR